MNYSLKNVKLIKQALALLSVCAVAALAYGALAYVQINRQIQLGENNSQLIMTLVQTARINILLHELDKNNAAEKPDAARQFLNRELASNVRNIKAMAPSTDGYRQWSANLVLAQVAKNEKGHPEKYLAAIQRTHL